MRLLLASTALLVAAQIALAQTTVSFPTPDGGVVFADVYESSSHPNTRAVLLIHGGQFKKESWAPQAKELAAAGFEVMAIDMRGFGPSHGPGDKDPMSAPIHLDALAAVRYLHAHGATSVSIVGASMGGWAAGDASIASNPGQIDRVVFLASAPNGPAGKLKSASLFLVARDDSDGSGELRLPGIRAQYDRAPQPKRLIIVPGSAHAQFLFQTDQSARVMKEILAWLNAAK